MYGTIQNRLERAFWQAFKKKILKTNQMKKSGESLPRDGIILVIRFKRPNIREDDDDDLILSYHPRVKYPKCSLPYSYSN
jgi:hypothetical protein